MNEVPIQFAHRPELFAALLCLATACDVAPAKTTDTNDTNDTGNDSTLNILPGLGALLDSNGDGQADVYDPHGNGSVVGPGVDANADGQPDAIGHDTDGDGVIDALDTTGDGVPDRFAPSGGDSDGDSEIVVVVPPAGSGGSAAGTADSNGTPEICDGIDNDGNGIVDDVDVGGDGICDCLNIGTIGTIGPWSSGGNIFTEWINSRSPQPATALGDQVLTPELLAPLNVIVVLRADTAPLGQDNTPAHHEFSAAEVAALEAWVRAGGGLMTTIGYQGDEVAEMANVNRLLAPFALGYDPNATNIASGFVDQWGASHPIAFGITQINIENGAGPLSTQGTIVGSTHQNEPALVVDQADLGRVVVFGDEWITYDSEWQDVAEQQVELFWLNVIKWMSPPTECQVEIPPSVVR